MPVVRMPAARAGSPMVLPGKPVALLARIQVAALAVADRPLNTDALKAG